MNNKLSWNIVGVGVVLIALVFGLSAVIDRHAEESALVTDTSETIEVSLTIDGLYVDKRMQVSAGETVLQLLMATDVKDPQVQLLIKEYSGMGTLVESIGGKSNGTEDKYWQYTVNGVMPPVGADALMVENGDEVEWKFTTSAF